MSMRALAMSLIFASLAACDHHDHQLIGYIEGEFVYVSSSVPGKLESLHVARGATVKQGTPLFKLEDTDYRAGLEAAQARLVQARATFLDVQKGQRPTELEALEAQYKQNQAALLLAEKEFERQQNIFRNVGGASQQDVDRARTARDQARQQVATIEAQLKTARLGARIDQIAAARANVDSVQAQQTQAEWQLAQTEQTAPADAEVSDTLYREGEWIAAGKPIVVLLPPGNIKARVYVSQSLLSRLRLGGNARLSVDGRGDAINGTISFISPTLEFTPPVIYSRDMREKLVALVEIVFAPADAITLHPGQPVDVAFDLQS